MGRITWKKLKKSKKKSRPRVATRALGNQTVYADNSQRPPLFPASTTKKMIYFDYGHEQTSTAASVSYYRYVANGMYDPDQTGGGHQPLGWDEMIHFYDQATCIRSKVTVTFVSESASTPMLVGVRLADDATNYTNASDLVEDGLVKCGIVVGTGGGPHQVKSFTLGCDVAAYFGRPRSKELTNDVTLATTAGANPTEAVYFDVFSFAAVNTTTVTVGYNVMIEYEAVFWEPRHVAQELIPVEQMKRIFEKMRMNSADEPSLETGEEKVGAIGSGELFLRPSNIRKVQPVDSEIPDLVVVPVNQDSVAQTRGGVGTSDSAPVESEPQKHGIVRMGGKTFVTGAPIDVKQQIEQEIAKWSRFAKAYPCRKR